MVKVKLQERKIRGKDYRSYYLTIPKEIVDFRNLKKGMPIEVNSMDEGILLIPKSEQRIWRWCFC